MSHPITTFDPADPVLPEDSFYDMVDERMKTESDALWKAHDEYWAQPRSVTEEVPHEEYNSHKEAFLAERADIHNEEFREEKTSTNYSL